MTRSNRQDLRHRLVEANCSVKSSPPTHHDVVFLCATFVRFTLPHRAHAAAQFERRDGNRVVTFMSPTSVGLPHGMWPRLILSYLSTQAVRTGCREIELGSSMSAFLRKLGSRATGGANGNPPKLSVTPCIRQTDAA
jgi:hypothetical protein